MSFPSAPTVNIDVLSPHEGPRLRDIRLRALLDAPDAFGSTWDEVSRRPPESWTAQLTAMTTLVAVIEGPDGPLDVGLVRGDRDDEGRNIRWLVSMWVAPEARRCGVGSALISTLIDWARTQGVEALRLDVGEHNEGAAALYRKHGFVPTGVRDTLPPPRSHITEVQYEVRF